MSPRTKVRAHGAPRTPRAPASAAGMPAAHVEDLGALDVERLAALLALRPDLAVPAPTSIEELEARAFAVPSVLRALLEADTSALQVVQIFTILGDKHAQVADVHRTAGDGTELEVKRALRWLAQRHLVVQVSNDELCVHPAFLSIAGAAALGPSAAGLVERLTVPDLQSVLGAIGRRAVAGRKAALVGDLLGILGDGDEVRALVEGAPDEARLLARKLATSSAPISLPWDIASGAYRKEKGGGTAPPAAWILQHGLAYRDSWTTAVMPREVGLALRGGHPFSASSYRRPQIEVAPLADPSETAVQARVLAVTQAVERIVERWGSRPAPVLKSGGVGVREVRRLAADTEMAEHEAFVLVEVAAAAGLVAQDARRGLVLPTPAADEWLDLDLTDRWWSLAHSWLGMTVHAGLAGAVDTRGKVTPALAYVPETEAQAPAQRLGLIRLVVELRHGSVDASTSLAEVASWDAPLAWSDFTAPAPLIARWVLSEMELLGLAVEGAPTALARALADGDAEGVRRLLAGFAADAWELVLQADLTGLATGRVPPQVRSELALLADVEGRGSATVYRFSGGSVRRAFDAGRTGEEVLAFLDAHAAKGVPQPLAYLVGDVERLHGQMRLGPATCYVRFDEAALATEVLRGKKTAKLGLRQIAPTVLVSDRPQQSVLSTLRACGYFPMQESADGTVLRTTVAPERAQSRRGPGPSYAAAHDVSDLRSGRWGLRSQGGGATTVGGNDRGRALAGALLGSARRTARPTSRRPEPLRTRLSPGIEIPTMLRRPRGAPAPPTPPMPAGLFDAFELDGAGFDALGIDDLDFEDGSVDDDALDDAVGDDDADNRGRSSAGGDRRHGNRPGRPTDIVYSYVAVLRLLQLAEEEEWLVRISYTSGAGKTFEATVGVLDVSDRAVLAQAAPRWSEQRYVLERIGWARVLTEVEEELAW